MRQAIEEGFILDVLANYTTYHTFWKIEKAIADDPEYDAKKARRAIARFVSLHPYQLAQKAEIIIEHFRAHTAREMQGLAKAMVVTSSRLHAVTLQAGDRPLRRRARLQGHQDAGRVLRQARRRHRNSADRAGMNGFPESQTAERFERAGLSGC